MRHGQLLQSAGKLGELTSFKTRSIFHFIHFKIRYIAIHNPLINAKFATMPSIYLIRHGQASFGQDNYDQLSDIGEQQATHLGKSLAGRFAGFDGVCLGALERHRQTAERTLVAMNNIELLSSAIKIPGWNEYDHQELLARLRPEFASAASMMAFVGQQANPKQFFEDSFNAAMSRWIQGQHDDDYSETWQQFVDRVHEALKQTLVIAKDKKRVAVFTSGGPISLISQHLLGVPAANIMQLNWTLLNCGVTKLVATSSRVFLASLNEHTHFESANHKHFLTYS